MKVRISMPGATAVMEMEEEKGKKVFKELVGQLLIYGTGSTKKKEELPVEAAIDAKEIKLPEPMKPLKEKPEPQEEKTELVEELSSPIPNGKAKYSGFMYIKCPKCGVEKAFCMKKPTDHFHCDSCGGRSEFESPLVQMFVNCECGRSSRYLTNMAVDCFDVNCIDCGSPVAVAWNAKKQQYETMRE